MPRTPVQGAVSVTSHTWGPAGTVSILLPLPLKAAGRCLERPEESPRLLSSAVCPVLGEHLFRHLHSQVSIPSKVDGCPVSRSW